MVKECHNEPIEECHDEIKQECRVVEECHVETVEECKTDVDDECLTEVKLCKDFEKEYVEAITEHICTSDPKNIDLYGPLSAPAPLSAPVPLSSSSPEKVCNQVLKDVCYPSPQTDGTMKEVCFKIPHMLCEVVTNLHTVLCEDVPKEVTRTRIEQVCDTMLEPLCTAVAKENCKDVDKPVCEDIEVCEDVLEEVCIDVDTDVCDDVVKQVCEDVEVKGCDSVEKEVCEDVRKPDKSVVKVVEDELCGEAMEEYCQAMCRDVIKENDCGLGKAWYTKPNTDKNIWKPKSSKKKPNNKIINFFKTTKAHKNIWKPKSSKKQQIKNRIVNFFKTMFA
jgi:hypothetical protein